MSDFNSNSIESFDELLYSLKSKKVSNIFIKKRLKEQNLDTALFQHINSLKILGKKRINSLNLSKTFQIPQTQIESSLERLNNRGIKIRKIS